MGQASRQRRYTAEFKRDAVALLNSSERSIAAVARELGVNETSLGTWARANQLSGDVKTRKHQSDAEREEELRLRKRVRELEQEIDILKRFTAYWVKEGK